MSKTALNERIEIKDNVLSGKPVIKGTRLSVQYVLGLLAKGNTISEIIKEYPDIEKDDILACLEFASTAFKDNTFLPSNENAA